MSFNSFNTACRASGDSCLYAKAITRSPASAATRIFNCNFLPGLPAALPHQQIAQNPARAGLGIRLALARPFADVVAEGQLAEMRAALQKIDVGVEHAAQRLSRGEDQLARGERTLDLGAEGIQFAHGNGVEDLLLVRVEAIERAHGDPGLLGHPAGGDLFERNAAEQRGCRVENLLDGPVAARLERRSSVG